MPRRLDRLLLETSAAAPLVIAQRLSRMAAAGSAPSQRDRREFRRMSDEKVAAFYGSWAAMWSQAIANQVALAQSMWLAPWRLSSPHASSARQHRDAQRILTAGIVPIHRTAVANARRLTRVAKKKR